MTKSSSRVLSNTMAATVARMCGLLLGFVVTPVLIHALGPEQFGLYAIVGSLTAYYGVLDLGIGAGLVRYLTFHSERREMDAVKQVMTFGLLFYLLLGLILLPIVLWSAPFFAHAMHLKASQSHMAEMLLVAMFVFFILSSMAGILNARVLSLHRMDIASYGGLFTQVLSSIALVALVLRFPNLYVVVGVSFGQLAIAAVVSYVTARRISPGFFCSPTKIKLAFVRPLFSFGVWSQICSITAVINLEADKLVIGRFLGVASVTPYQIGNRAAMLNRILPLQLLGALLPDTTAAVSRGMSRAEMEATYARNTRYLMISTLLITGFVIAVAGLFIKVWIGNAVPLAALVTVALGLSYSVNNLTGVGTVFMRAEGKLSYETAYAVLSAVANIVITIILVPRFGLYGVVGGTIIGNCIGSVFFVVLFHRVTRFPWWSTVGRWLVPLVIGVAIAVGATQLTVLAVPAGWTANRMFGLIVLALSGVVYTAVLFGALSVLRFWNAEDLLLLRRTSHRFMPSRWRSSADASPSAGD